MNNRKIFLLLLLWAMALLMLISIDSPLHESYNRVDSSWFYMCGKAWMNGLKPYVDFADSKGPLLWLIYGIGYLLAPHSYQGIYWISCLLYAVIFYYDYKMARLFFTDLRRPLMVTLLMTFAYFSIWFHYEVRAEDFSTLFVTISLYELFQLLYGKDTGSQGGKETGKEVRRVSLILGGCFMALVLIKYSIALMQGSIILVALYFYARQQKTLLHPLKWMAAGAGVVALPFVVYFLVTGTWSAFIQEYIVNTFKTVQPGGEDATMLSSYLGELMESIRTPSTSALLMVIVYGAWLMSQQLPRYRFAPMFVGVCFFLLATMHNFLYYYCICAPFVIYIFIYTISLLRKPIGYRSFAVVVLAIAAWSIYDNVKKDLPLARVAIWADNDDKQFFNTVSDIIATVPHQPRIFNLLSFELGFGIEQKALPVGKYWGKQNGMTVEMQQEHVGLLFSKQADIVIVYDEEVCDEKGFTRSNISSLGYKLCYTHTHQSMWRKQVTTSVYKKMN